MTPGLGAQKAGSGLCSGSYRTGRQIVFVNCSQKSNIHLKTPRSQLHGPIMDYFELPAGCERTVVICLEDNGNECLLNAGLEGKGDDQRGDIERWAYMQGLRLPQWRACFPYSRNFTCAAGTAYMVKLRSGHITPGLRGRAKNNKTKARLHRKETGDHGCGQHFRRKDFSLHDIPSTRRQAGQGIQARLDENL